MERHIPVRARRCRGSWEFFVRTMDPGETVFGLRKTGCTRAGIGEVVVE